MLSGQIIFKTVVKQDRSQSSICSMEIKRKGRKPCFTMLIAGSCPACLSSVYEPCQHLQREQRSFVQTCQHLQGEQQSFVQALGGAVSWSGWADEHRPYQRFMRDSQEHVPFENYSGLFPLTSDKSPVPRSSFLKPFSNKGTRAPWRNGRF